MYSRLSRHFQVIRFNEEFTEFKSKYHYWRTVRHGQSQFFLHHKHNKCDTYHRQIKYPVSINKIIKIVIDHDAYIDSIH